MKKLIIAILPILFISLSITAQDNLLASANTTDTEPVNKNASYIGEGTDVVTYFSENFEYPLEARENGISGKAQVRLLIKEDGTPTFLSVSGVEAPSIDAEITSLVEEMPKWEPAIKDGKPSKQVVKFNMDLRLD